MKNHRLPSRYIMFLSFVALLVVAVVGYKLSTNRVDFDSLEVIPKLYI